MIKMDIGIKEEAKVETFEQRVEELTRTGRAGKGVIMTIRQIRNEIKRLDPQLKQDDTSFVTAVIMLSAIEVGADAERIAKFSGVGLGQVMEREHRLRKNKVWVGEKTHHSGWDDKESGGIAFWMDVCIADGLLVRSGSRAPKSQKIGAV